MACTAEQQIHWASRTAGPHALLSCLCCSVNPSNDAISCPRCVSSCVMQSLRIEVLPMQRQSVCFSAAALKHQSCTLCRPPQEKHSLLSFLLLGSAMLHLSISAHSALLASEAPCRSVKSMKPHHNQQQQHQPECIASHACMPNPNSIPFHLTHQKSSHHTKSRRTAVHDSTAQIKSSAVSPACIANCCSCNAPSTALYNRNASCPHADAGRAFVQAHKMACTPNVPLKGKHNGLPCSYPASCKRNHA